MGITIGQPIVVVRTLKTVGGYRARLVHSRRRNDRFARKQGFANWDAFVTAYAIRKQLRESMDRIAENIKQHTATGDAA